MALLLGPQKICHVVRICSEGKGANISLYALMKGFSLTHNPSKPVLFTFPVFTSFLSVYNESESQAC